MAEWGLGSTDYKVITGYTVLVYSVSQTTFCK